jgi:hypothetical protein
MKYTDFKFLYPPRPETAVVTAMLSYFEKQGWVAQYKKNGTCTIVGIAPNKDVILMNRHGESHKAWFITEHLKGELARLFPENKWFLLVAEIMHSKGPTIKDTLFVHDMLVWKSDMLLDSTFKERQDILDNRLITNVEGHSHYVLDDKNKLWYAKRFDKDFKKIFNSIRDPKIDEGLVLKDPEGKLRNCLTPTDNSYWMVKCRHKSKGYAF